MSGVILYYSPKYTAVHSNSVNNLDSLITLHFFDDPIIGTSFKKYTIEVDSSFTRSVFRIEVPRGYSKTMFHYNLHKSFLKYNIAVPARVVFPERDMNIYIKDDDIIRSTIRLISADTETNTEVENG